MFQLIITDILIFVTTDTAGNCPALSLKISSGCTLPIVKQSLKLRSPVIPPSSPQGMTVFFWPLGGSNKQAVNTELAYYQHPDMANTQLFTHPADMEQHYHSLGLVLASG